MLILSRCGANLVRADSLTVDRLPNGMFSWRVTSGQVVVDVAHFDSYEKAKDQLKHLVIWKNETNLPIYDLTEHRI